MSLPGGAIWPQMSQIKHATIGGRDMQPTTLAGGNPILLSDR